MRQTYTTLSGAPGYFDPEAATAYADMVDDAGASLATGGANRETLYATPGRWIVHRVERYPGPTVRTWREVTAVDAAAWLARNGHELAA